MANIKDQNQDTILAQKAQQGDAEAFGLLYDKYIKAIYNFIYYKTLNKEIAEDLTSQSFMKALKNIQQFHGGSFQAWLYAIARNSVIDHYRTHKEHGDIEDCWDLADNKDWLESIDNHLQLEAVHKALHSLRLKERELIIMRVWLDMPYKNIAEQLDKSEAAVKVAFSRSLEKLKSQLPLTLLFIYPYLINIWDQQK